MQAIQTTMFDYAALDAETRIVVQQRTTEIKALMKRAASDIIEIGQKLIEVKARLDHGNWIPWLHDELGCSPDTAQRFIRVAKAFDQKPQIAAFDPSALYLLAAPSTPESARIEAIARAEEGEPISHGLARGIIHDHLHPAEPFEPSADDYEGEQLTDYERRAALRYLESQAADLGLDVKITPAGEYQEPQIIIEQAPAIFMGASVEWYTPAVYVEAARATMGGIDTDPASNEAAQTIVQAETYYTEDVDGFDKSWRGRVWLNPPYGAIGGRAVAAQWTERLIQQFDLGIVTEAILLVNAVIDSKWFDQLWRFPICFTNHRIRFDLPAGAPADANTSPIIGSAFVYMGSNVAAFVREFSRFGAVVSRLHTYDDQVFTEMELAHDSTR